MYLRPLGAPTYYGVLGFVDPELCVGGEQIKFIRLGLRVRTKITSHLSEGLLPFATSHATHSATLDLSAKPITRKRL